MAQGKFLIGTSGYQYDHWRGVFYPEDLPKNQWFSYYAERFNIVEINNTFYNLPKPETFEKWRDSAPDDFQYVLKFSRYGSHIKRLKDPAASIDKFWDAAQYLGDKLAGILLQLPPKWKPVPDRLAAFFEHAPANVRWALEVRDERWFTDEVFDTLKEHNVALCIHDMIPSHPEVVTADWVYLRFHGDHYTGSYADEELQNAAQNIRNYLSQGLDVVCFFNNDAEGYAVQNATQLKDIVGA